MNSTFFLSRINLNKKILKSIFVTIAIMVFFLFSIQLMTNAFSHLGHDMAKRILVVASNPFIGLFVGLLITALIQSSSTCTSMVIALVASNAISVTDAIPIVMGANIGTTLTSTIVALGFLSEKGPFRKAISSAMLHDIFNISTVILLFPLELKYGILSTTAQQIASLFVRKNINNELLSSIDSISFSGAVDQINYLIPNDLLRLVIAAAMLFVSLKLFSNVIYKKLIADSKQMMNSLLFGSVKKAFLWGTLSTSVVQSSSITTSLVVPLVAKNKLKLKMAFPFVVGANVGTTITGFIAAFSQSEAAIMIAIVHFLFNAFGAILFLPFAFIRKIPIQFATQLGRLTLKSRFFGFIYLVLTFFLIPFILIYFNK